MAYAGVRVTGSFMEEWKDIPGYEGSYQVSTHGRVRSVQREICTNRGLCKIWPGIVMKQYVHWRGYYIIFLRRPGEKKKKFFVHRLVALAFIENPEDKPIVNHKNGDRKDNRLDNLEWMTDSENVRHGNDRRATADEPF